MSVVESSLANIAVNRFGCGASDDELNQAGIYPKQWIKTQLRDLMPTSNSFSWIANVLTKHWHFTEQELIQVFTEIKSYNQPLILSRV